jgi:hypothetical protein
MMDEWNAVDVSLGISISFFVEVIAFRFLSV